MHGQRRLFIAMAAICGHWRSIAATERTFETLAELLRLNCRLRERDKRR
jgi:hypothetical protein